MKFTEEKKISFPQIFAERLTAISLLGRRKLNPGRKEKGRQQAVISTETVKV